MFKKSKVMVGISSLMLGSLVLAACGDNGDTAEETGNEGETTSEETTSGDKVTLSYANWNLGTEGDANIERMMIDAFNESQDGIEVVIDDTVTTDDWDGSLSTAASAGDLPDVFMMNNIPTSYSNDWLLDVSDIAAADEEFEMIPEAIRTASQIEGQTVSIPFATHLMGYYVNNDILNDLNLPLAEYGVSMDEFLEGIRSSTNIDQDIVGIEIAAQIADWYPGSVNEELGWFTYNEQEGTYSLDSPEMAEGINTARDIAANGYAYVNMSEEDKERMSGGDSGAAFRNGQITYSFNGTWMNQSFTTETDFDWDFIGIPGGNNVIVNDFIGIAKSTENAEEAYEFAKFMSFGKEGFMQRVAFVEENDFGFNTLPISTDQEILDAYWEQVDIPGIKAAYDDLDGAMVEGFKVVPGYVNSRFEATTGVSIGEEENATIGYILDQSVAGNVNFQDYASQLQELAQQAHDEAVEAMGISEE
ncbi:ABC transporter substrate-binding protein [Alkalibacterium sp. f15]|uniref:ABC transporter substrate-binding protein n=1 Tax=Alkalibacterium sp. f15 TaxID=3414029 RepID=UPI003BF8A7C3